MLLYTTLALLFSSIGAVDAAAGRHHWLSRHDDGLRDTRQPFRRTRLHGQSDCNQEYEEKQHQCFKCILSGEQSETVEASRSDVEKEPALSEVSKEKSKGENVLILQQGTLLWSKQIQGALLSAFFYGYVVTQVREFSSFIRVTHKISSGWRRLGGGAHWRQARLSGGGTWQCNMHTAVACGC